MVPGRVFELIEAGPELDGDYTITAVIHEYEARQVEASGAYHNRFRCVPASVVHRPRAWTPKPRVGGPHTATVVGDEEIHTDEHGRVRVQFHWQEQASFAADASCWIRCAQSWSGMGWGSQFIPRVGMEVVVEFIEGNPDRPLITGCVYNGLNPLPFVTPGQKTQSGWRTSSTPGGEGYNMLRFDDTAGREEIHVHGQRDWTIAIEHDKSAWIGHDESERVGNDRSLDVVRDLAEQIGKNHTSKVGVDRRASVGRDLELRVGHDQIVEVDNEATLDVGERLTLVCGESSLILDKSGAIQLRGKSIRLLADRITEN